MNAINHRRQFNPLLCWLSSVCFAISVSAATAAPEVDLDDVACALCHYEQGEAFAQSIHFNSGLLLCNDCHGGLPFEFDNDLAKAPGTDFIGRPQRQDIVRVCGTCHVASVRFFAQGPHADWNNAENPTCISCHSNHDVRGAELAMMDTTCAPCHETESPELATGLAIRRDLNHAASQLVAVSMIVDSLAMMDRSLRRAQPLVVAARTALTDAGAGTHAMSVETTDRSLASFADELEAARELVDEHEVVGEHRQMAVASIWVFIAVNLLILWVKRRQLD
jgi:hypothetical protein